MTHYSVSRIGKILLGDEETVIEIDPQYRPALQSLEGFSHVNVLCWFHDCDNDEARSILEVPQPYKKAPPIMGVFATRAPARPNPIALSTAQIIRIDREKGRIQIAYIDAHDGTPVLDIKPYTPSMDSVKNPSVPDWCGHWPKSVEESGEFDWESEFCF